MIAAGCHYESTDMRAPLRLAKPELPFARPKKTGDRSPVLI
jgi:hypothetical protein